MSSSGFSTEAALRAFAECPPGWAGENGIGWKREERKRVEHETRTSGVRETRELRQPRALSRHFYKVCGGSLSSAPQ